MRRVAWRWALGAACSIVTIAPARAAFECLPGPVAGGLADWMGRTVWEEDRRGGAVAFSLVRPAAVDGLIGAHAAASGRAGLVFLAAETYRLALEDLYAESAWGLWAGLGPARAGVRRWEARWDAVGGRSGWSLSIAARTRLRRWGAWLGLQDALLRGDRSVAPHPRRGVGIAWRARGDLELDAEVYESERRGIAWGLRWSPARGVLLLEEIRIPEEGLQSGLEIETGSVRGGVWLTPVSAIGVRAGISATMLLRGAPRP